MKSKVCQDFFSCRQRIACTMGRPGAAPGTGGRDSTRTFAFRCIRRARVGRSFDPTAEPWAAPRGVPHGAAASAPAGDCVRHAVTPRRPDGKRRAPLLLVLGGPARSLVHHHGGGHSSFEWRRPFSPRFRLSPPYDGWPPRRVGWVKPVREEGCAFHGPVSPDGCRPTMA